MKGESYESCAALYHDSIAVVARLIRNAAMINLDVSQQALLISFSKESILPVFSLSTPHQSIHHEMSASYSGASFTGKITDANFRSVFSRDRFSLGSNLDRYMTDMIRSANGDEAVTADVLSNRLTTAENGGAREVQPYKAIQSVLDVILTGEVPPGVTPIADIPSNYDEIHKFLKGVNGKYKSETLRLSFSEMLSVTTAWLALGIATPDQVKSGDCIWTLKVHRAFCLLLRKHQWGRAEAAKREELEEYGCG
jgi:hypothetical protein